MILVHAALTGPGLHVWGESDQDLSPRELGEALDGAVPGLAAGAISPEPLLAWLPTAQRRPLPSSPLLEASPPGPRPARAQIVPWPVSTLPLGPAPAVLLLASASGRDTLAPGLIVSKDLAFWAMVLRFAGSLALRQRFLPGMVESGEGWRARWTPVLDGADAKRRVKLAKTMPGACRALSPARDQPPDTTSLEALDAAAAMLVDELAREAAAGAIAVAAPESAHEAWLQALGAADGVIRWDRGEVDRLAAAVKEWRRPVAAATDAPFRLCFRLEEPAPQEDGQPRPWSVRYLLQSRRDRAAVPPSGPARPSRRGTAAR